MATKVVLAELFRLVVPAVPAVPRQLVVVGMMGVSRALCMYGMVCRFGLVCLFWNVYFLVESFFAIMVETWCTWARKLCKAPVHRRESVKWSKLISRA